MNNFLQVYLYTKLTLIMNKINNNTYHLNNILKHIYII